MTTSPNPRSNAPETTPAAPAEFFIAQRSNLQRGVLSHPMCDALRRTLIWTHSCIDAGANLNQNPGGAPE
jgi:hypothetical protein